MSTVEVEKSEFLIEIDPPISAAQDVIGRRIKIRIGDDTGFITFPKSLVDEELKFPSPRKWPTFPGLPSSHAASLTSNVALESGAYKPSSSAFLVSALRVRLDRDPKRTTSKRSAEIYREIAKIVDIARNWIAVWTRTPQVVLRQDMYPYGIGADLINGEWRAYFLPGSNVLYPLSNFSLNIDTIKSAIQAGCDGVDVPLEHQLLVNSEFGIIISQHRNSIIDLCCAAELALSNRIRNALNEDVHRTNSSRAVLKGVMGIVELFRIYDGMFQSAVSLNDVRDKLAAIRNKAVHEGVVPTHSQTKSAIEIARQLIFEASPLPFPQRLV